MKTIGEINALQEKFGWVVPIKLTLNEVLRASSDLVRFWELKAPKVLEAVTNSKMTHAKAKASNARQLLTSAVHTDESIAQAAEAMCEFLQRFPQYIPSDSNRNAMALCMLDKALDLRDANDIAEAFVECCKAGSITVQVGDQQLTGNWLQHAIRKDETLLDPLPRKETAEAKARRDVEETIRNTPSDVLKTAIQQQFREENSQQQSVFEERGVDQAVETLLTLRPAYIPHQENNDKVVAYLGEHNLPWKPESFLSAYDFLTSINQLELREGNVHRWNGTTSVDYGAKSNRGGTAVNIAARMDKDSLRRKVAGLSTRATAQFFRDNPGARAAIDAV